MQYVFKQLENLTVETCTTSDAFAFRLDLRGRTAYPRVQYVTQICYKYVSGGLLMAQNFQKAKENLEAFIKMMFKRV